MGKYTLNDCSTFEFARLLSIVCKSCPEYRPDGRMCYWYTSMMVSILKSVFNGQGKLPSSRAGKHSGRRVHTDDPREIAEITQKYLHARSADPFGLEPSQHEREGERRARSEREREQSERERERSERERERSEQKRERREQEHAELIRERREREEAQEELRRERSEREHEREQAQKAQAQLQAQLAEAQERERRANEASKS